MHRRYFLTCARRAIQQWIRSLISVCQQKTHNIKIFTTLSSYSVYWLCEWPSYPGRDELMHRPIGDYRPIIGRLIHAKFHANRCSGGVLDPKVYILQNLGPQGHIFCAILMKFSKYVGTSMNDRYFKFGRIRSRGSNIYRVRFRRNFSEPSAAETMSDPIY